MTCDDLPFRGYLQGRFLEEPWQDHGPGKLFGRSANFPHFDRNFLYILCLARAYFSAYVFRPWHVQRARSATGHLLTIQT
ncbi:hypothetical protein HanIR_Chr09g0428361 [Helianthus annuus]|nr:hypothetical protein HanIR_Chr09g0428361 [Helianthus annuus]